MLFPTIFFLFVAVPIIEIFVLIKVGSSIGALATIGIVILTAIIGTWMLRAQGLSTLNKARLRLSGGQIPAFELMEGMALGVGGALLLTPGFVTDTIGFFCLIPFTRRLLINALSKRVSIGAGGFTTGSSQNHGSSSQYGSGTTGSGTAGSTTGTSSTGTRQSKIDGDVIEGEYTRKE